MSEWIEKRNDAILNFEMHPKDVVFYFPIVSMRSHKTGKFDLSKDGNINRALSFFNKTNVKFLTIKLAIAESDLDVDGYSVFLKWIRALERSRGAEIQILFEEFSLFENAYDQRFSIGPWDVRLLNEGEDNVIIYERESIGSYLRANHKLIMDRQTIFWSPVSATKDNIGCSIPSFLADFEGIDRKLAKSADLVIVSTKKQKDYFDELNKNIVVFNDFIDFSIVGDPLVIKDLQRKINEESLTKTIIYFPFRLSDKGYKFQEVLDVCEGKNVKIVVTDPNDTLKDFDTSKVNIEKVSSNRDVYYTYLQSNVVVPYLEDLSKIWHASANECSLLCKNTLYSIEDLKKVI